MATKGKDALIGRAVTDPDFRRRLLENPEQTIQQEGYEIPAELVEQLKNLDADAAEAATRDLEDFATRRAAG